jgi:hypothetical protein
MNITKQTAFMKNRPVTTGVFTVVGVFSVGVGLAFAGGFVTPTQAHAFLPPCCTLPPVPPPPPPPPPTPTPHPTLANTVFESKKTE